MSQRIGTLLEREGLLAREIDNANQGSFIIEELTDLVEEAVLIECEHLTERDGVLGVFSPS